MLVCEVLYGKGLRCGGPLKAAVRKHVDQLKLAWKSVQHSVASPGNR